ncbi:MAG TPA: hypothetical protein VNT92_00080 [Acidimicrobiia bacterium]|nr:hypothetical protein [Acidimicrobiia bacterium]
MADQNINPVGCLGRVLTVLGVLWLGFVVLGGIGVLSDVGISEGFFAGALGSAIPAVLLLWAGRALRRRARTIEVQTLPAPVPPPDPSEKRVPTMRVESSQVETPPVPIPPAPSPVKSVPRPVPSPKEPLPSPKEPLPNDLIDLPPPLIPPEPKTSRQLIDEARKKWGRPRT